MSDTIYVIKNEVKRFAYIGRTYRPLVVRWTEHLNHAADGDTKTLYEYMRLDPDAFTIEELDSGAFTEAEWLEAFKSDGWTLLNETGGNRKAPKKRDTAKERAWRDMNAQAKHGDAPLNSKYTPPPGMSLHDHFREMVRESCAEICRRWETINPAYFAQLRAEVDRLKAERICRSS